MENQKKKDKISFLLTFLVIVAVGAGMFIYNRSIGNVAPKVVIDGVELTTSMTVQDLVDAGFEIRLSSNSYTSLSVEGHEKIPGESYTSTIYYLFKETNNGVYRCTNVNFSVYNPSVNAADFAQSRVYRYVYYTDMSEDKFEVTINGVDFEGMTSEEAVAAFEETGLAFEEEDKQEFLSGEFSRLTGKPRDFYYRLSQDYEGMMLESVEVEKHIK